VDHDGDGLTHAALRFVMPGLVPGIHVLEVDPRRGWPGTRAFTPVFNGLCPAMTESFEMAGSKAGHLR
jgi:hypothetical protein